uniref:Major facilitator superfamily (MFS) profile domain-containing protein n=1 Tax=Plectus sambesii TaxID=2011161 RepID=A0A914WI24_9BILA
MGVSYHLGLMSLAAGFAGNFQLGYLASVLTQPYIAIEQYVNSSVRARTGVDIDEDGLKMLMSALNIVNPLAAIVGQMMALSLCNRLGRKNTAIIGCLMNFPGILLSLFAKWLHPAYEVLFVGRLIWSVAVGILVVNQTIWLVEAAPAKHRGSVSSLQEVFAALGGLITQAAGVPFSSDELWPLMFAFPLLVNVLCIIAFYMVPESPQFLLFQRNSQAEAKKAIAKYHGLTDEYLISEQMNLVAAGGESEDAQEKGKGEGSKTHAMDVMFRPWKAKDDVSRVLRYGAWVGLMVKLAYLFTGTRCIRSFNTFVLFELGKWSYLDARVGSLAIGILRLPVTLIPVFFVDRIGRRPLLLSSAGSSVLFLIMIMICIFLGEDFKIGTLLGVTCLLTVNSIGLGSLARFYAAELVPHKLLLKSVSVLAIIETLFRIALEFSFYPAAHFIGAHFFSFFILPSIFFFVLIYLYCPETKGRGINDVLNKMAIDKGVEVTFQV